MIPHKKIILSLLFALLFSACGFGGGTEFGNPGDPPRVVKGALSSSSGSISKQLITGCRIADTVIATDSSAATQEEAIANDCTFEMTLTSRRAYAFSFWLNDAFVASLAFNNGSAFLSSEYMYLGSGTSAIDLGTITVAGRVMISSLIPAEQTDRDDDGISDFEDDDDDDDGTLDADEQDCDLDGIIDDEDDDQSECEDTTSSEGVALVLEVEPRRGEGVGDPNNAVDLDAEVQARFSCAVNVSTVTADTFSVEANDDAIECAYELSGSDERVSCRHDDDPFGADTIYTVTVDGVECQSGEQVLSTSWPFQTGS